MKVHIGCGRKILVGYTNIDLLDYGQEVVGDAFEWLNVQSDDSLDEIRCEHFLEHFTHDQLQGWFAVFNMKLKPGGKLIVVVPGWQRPEAYYLVHHTVFTKATFEMLGNPELCEPYGWEPWKIEQLIENNRGDIHCTLAKL